MFLLAQPGKNRTFPSLSLALPLPVCPSVATVIIQRHLRPWVQSSALNGVRERLNSNSLRLTEGTDIIQSLRFPPSTYSVWTTEHGHNLSQGHRGESDIVIFFFLEQRWLAEWHLFPFFRVPFSLFPSSSSPDALLGYFPVYLLEEDPALSLNYSSSSINPLLAHRGGEQAFEVGYGRRFRDLRITPCAAVPPPWTWTLLALIIMFGLCNSFWEPRIYNHSPGCNNSCSRLLEIS